MFHLKSTDDPTLSNSTRAGIGRPWAVLLLALLTGLVSCTSQSSRDNFATLLCWLRPSCLPSEGTSGTADTSPPLPVRPSSKPAQAQLPPPCHMTAKTTISDKKPSVTVSYVEPTTQVDGTPLTNLAKTSIYRSYGNGFIKTKDVPASSAQGGGTITETLFLAVEPGETVEVTICVTATNSLGIEG